MDRAKAELLLAEKEVESRRASGSSAQSAVERLRHQRAAAAAEIKRITAEDEYLHHRLQELEPLADKQYVTGDQLRQARSRLDASRAELADAVAKEQAMASAIAEAESESSRAQSLIAQVAISTPGSKRPRPKSLPPNWIWNIVSCGRRSPPTSPI
ncbi:hypothetical protein [Methylomonas koyamae]|uniref:hypothetical protein n=1 Tax=Methylomonas koyamae TaxID=702114 RepID=UPI0021108FFD|nr:hypothetical protein [Methylomonas koyamae]